MDMVDGGIIRPSGGKTGHTHAAHTHTGFMLTPSANVCERVYQATTWEDIQGALLEWFMDNGYEPPVQQN